MKHLLILTFLFSLVACQDEKIRLEDTYGTKLVAIDYTKSDETWTVLVNYDIEGNISSLDSDRGEGSITFFNYNDSLISSIVTVDSEDNVTSKDSIVYLSGKLMHQRLKYSKNGVGELKLNKQETFEYDSQNRIIKATELYPFSNFTKIKTYVWGVENVDTVYTSSVDHFLLNEEIYEYDDRHNFREDFPIQYLSPYNWGDNNVTSFVGEDFAQQIEWTCNPCTREYIYNRDDFPVKITISSGVELLLTYE